MEVLCGITQEPVFGPLVVFGLGGVTTDVFDDRDARLSPLTDLDAAELVRAIRSAPLLLGHRGRPPADVNALEDVLTRLSRLADDRPEIAELDLNPVRTSRLQVIHAWRLPTTLRSADDTADVAEIEQGLRQALTRTLVHCRERHSDMVVVEEVMREHPVSALVGASDGAILLVVGPHGCTGRGMIRLGSVGHGVIHQARCPVAVIRPRGMRRQLPRSSQRSALEDAKGYQTGDLAA